MAAPREKTLSYRRAEWIPNAAIPNLEKCLKQALSRLQTVDERTIWYGARNVRCAKSGQANIGGIYMHLTADTPGESTSVVPKAKAGATEVDLATEKPPSYGEWLDGDAFLYINENHLCLCGTSLRDGSITNFLRELIKKAGLPENYTAFLLLKAADIAKIKLINKQGVKELEIRGSLYKASATYVKRKSQVSGMLGAIARHAAATRDQAHNVTPDALRCIVTIRTDGRFKKELALGEKNIKLMATDVVKNAVEDDDYVIVTKTGQKISPKEIFIRSTVAIDASGKTVDRDKAWRELNKFFQSLEAAGIFHQ